MCVPRLAAGFQVAMRWSTEQSAIFWASRSVLASQQLKRRHPRPSCFELARCFERARPGGMTAMI